MRIHVHVFQENGRNKKDAKNGGFTSHNRAKSFIVLRDVCRNVKKLMNKHTTEWEKPLLISERYTFQVSVCCIKTVTLSAYFAPGKIPTTLQTSKTEKTHKTENRFF